MEGIQQHRSSNVHPSDQVCIDTSISMWYNLEEDLESTSPFVLMDTTLAEAC